MVTALMKGRKCRPILALGTCQAAVWGMRSDPGVLPVLLRVAGQGSEPWMGSQEARPHPGPATGLLGACSSPAISWFPLRAAQQFRWPDPLRIGEGVAEAGKARDAGSQAWAWALTHHSLAV